MTNGNVLESSEEATCAGVASSAPLNAPNTMEREGADIGVSTSCAHNLAHWYALRTTYGRERRAYEYLVSKGVRAFYPTITNVRIVDGKRKTFVESRLPNIFFAYGTEDQLKTYVYDNVNLPFLRFYYRRFSIGRDKHRKEPMIVPQRQMDSLMIICHAESEDTFMASEEIRKFRKGQLVRITSGEFAGVVGRVTRFKGQQRVGIYIDGLLTIATAFVPSKHLEFIEETDKYEIGK